MAARRKSRQPENPDAERLKSVLQLSSDWYWEQDENLRFTYFSGRAFGDAGFESASLIGRTRWEIPGVRFEPDERAALQAKLDARQPFSDYEYRHTGPDGVVRYISTSGIPMFDAAGRFTGYRGTSRDITKRKRAEEEQSRFHAAIDTSADMIALVDRATMRFIDVNATACEMQGYSREEMLQMGPQDIIPMSREAIERGYDETIASGRTTQLETYLHRRDGTRTPVEVLRRAARSGDRWIIVAIVRDISGRRRAEQLLALEHAVNRTLAEADTAAGAVKAVIRAVCETQEWECGRYFSVDDKAGVLRFSDAWSVPGAGFEAFIEKSRDVTYAPGVGLTGLM